MNIKKYLLVALASAFIVACGSNSTDKETTATTDTSIISALDTATVIPADTTKTVVVNVPAKTKTVFEKKYPKATNVKWESNKPAEKAVEWDLADWPEADEEGHNAWFNWQGSDHKAYYDNKGNWVGTVDILVDPSTLPPAVTNSINKEFKGYTVTGIKRKNDNKRTAFQLTLEKNGEKIKALIDENGNVVKK